MRKLHILLLLSMFSIGKGICQFNYEQAYFNIAQNLNSNSQLSFKRTVFEIERGFNETLSFSNFQGEIDYLAKVIKSREMSDSLFYDYADRQLVKKYAAIFRTLTDTTRLIFGENLFENYPFHYDFDDMFGDRNWENMFVTKLLATRKGNCHSMPYLYKILCDELGVPCHLALAPNHIYIKHRSEKAGWYNTELTSASFPIDAWLMASGYITLEAIQNGLYMDTLDNKKCIALCVLDLAKGYDKKYTDNDGAFILKCCDLALQYFPNCINALLLKAETRKKQIDRLCRLRNIPPSVLRRQNDGKILWDDMTTLYTTIHKLGYRTMPEQMYVDWLLLLQKEREKYSNKQVTEISR